MKAQLANGTGNSDAPHLAGRWTALLALLVALPAGSPAAQVTLQQGVNGYTGTTDTWLDESAKSDNYGGAPYVRVQYNSGMSDSTLLKFALPPVTFQSIATAALGLYYYDYSSMSADNAAAITPYRVTPGMSWYENTYNGSANHGANWRYRDADQTLPWTSQNGAWNDKLDDGNSSSKIKRPGGSVPDALAPPAWVTWSVGNSVAQWYGGQANDGFVLFESGFQGSGYIAAGLFSSRENGLASYCPYLTINYQGAAITWGGYVNGAWDTATPNWNVGGYPGTFGTGDFVTFTDGASNPAIAVIAGGVSPGSVTINNSATTYSFAGGGIGGGGGLTKMGPGTATLSAANSFTGFTLVKGGKLIVAVNNALGIPAGGTVVSVGAALGFQGSVNYSATEPLTISGAGVSSSGALYAVSGLLNTFAGPVTLAADATIGVASGTGLTLNGTLGGAGNLTKIGSGKLTLGGAAANILADEIRVDQGTLALAKSAGVAVAGNVIVGDGTNVATARLEAAGQLAPTSDVLVRYHGSLSLNGYNAAIDGLNLDGGGVSTSVGTLTVTGVVSSIGNQTATIMGNLDLGGGPRDVFVADGAASDDLIVSAAITNGGLTKLGSGRLALSGNSPYTGATVVSNGALAVSAPNALGDASAGTEVKDGASLELRNSVTVPAEPLVLCGAGGGAGALHSVGLNDAWGGPITLSGPAEIQSDFGTLTLQGTIDGAGFPLTFDSLGSIAVNGAITGTGTMLIKSGSSGLTLGGNTGNSYTGPTIVNQGLLVLGKTSGLALQGPLAIGDGLNFATVMVNGPGQLPSVCEVSLRTQGALRLNNFSAAVGSLTFTGGSVDSGLAGLLTLDGPVTNNGALNGAIFGNLNIAGAFQGITVMSTSDLEIHANVSGGGFVKLGPGRLVLTGNNSFVGSASISAGTLLLLNDPNTTWGTGPADVFVDNTAVLSGTGSARGPVTVLGGGTLSPGENVGPGTLIVSNRVHLLDNAALLVEVGGPAPAIDALDLKGGGRLDLDGGAQLRLAGVLLPPKPYVIVRNAEAVFGTFLGLPQNAPLPPPNEAWFIHYGTHRIYLSQVPNPLVYFRAFATNGVVVVAWRTALELETKAFDLLRWEGGGWVKVNTIPIPAQNPNGAIYVVVDAGARAGDTQRYRLVEYTNGGDEPCEFERTPTEFAFSEPPRPMDGGVELRWFSRTDETYDLLGSTNLALPGLRLLLQNLRATPPENVVTNLTGTPQGYYRLRLVP